MVLDSSVDRDLERAAHRAYARDLSATLVRICANGPDQSGSEFYDVASFSQPGAFHRVRLDYTSAGISAFCDCIGSQQGHVCQHMATALEASAALCQPEPAPRLMSPSMQMLDDAGLLGPSVLARFDGGR